MYAHSCTDFTLFLACNFLKIKLKIKQQNFENKLFKASIRQYGPIEEVQCNEEHDTPSQSVAEQIKKSKLREIMTK